MYLHESKFNYICTFMKYSLSKCFRNTYLTRLKALTREVFGICVDLLCICSICICHLLVICYPSSRSSLSPEHTSTQYSLLSTQYTVHSTQYTVHSIQYTVHSTQYNMADVYSIIAANL